MTPTASESLSLRLRFEKRGPIRFISHLDLTRAFHRAFIRADLPLKYSEGFSPHPRFSIALPLSVGTESMAEFADVTLQQGFSLPFDEIRSRLQDALPTGITLVSVSEQTEKFSAIHAASYQVTLPNADPAAVEKILPALQGSITVKKRNKKGKTIEKEISQAILSVKAEAKDGGVLLDLCLAANAEDYLKPETVLSVLGERLSGLDQSEKRILRTAVWLSDMTIFE